MLLAAVKAHAGFHLQISRFFQMFLKLNSEETFVCCHTATLTNFLCYTQISQVQGKSTYLRVPFSP